MAVHVPHKKMDVITYIVHASINFYAGSWTALFLFEPVPLLLTSINFDPSMDK